MLETTLTYVNNVYNCYNVLYFDSCVKFVFESSLFIENLAFKGEINLTKTNIFFKRLRVKKITYKFQVILPIHFGNKYFFTLCSRNYNYKNRYCKIVNMLTFLNHFTFSKCFLSKQVKIQSHSKYGIKHSPFIIIDKFKKETQFEVVAKKLPISSC